MTFPISKKLFFAAAIGTMVEYYDFALFLTFLPILAPVFFPATSIYESLVKGYIILFISALARPLGGIIFGHIGDKFGRRHALLASLYGIALATLIIGITPSYASAGTLAIMVILTAKAVQAFCFGGEFNGAGIYIIEHAQAKSEALMGSLLTATTLIGSLLASFIGIIVTLPFMPAWSWRLAFIMGGMFGIAGIIYRKNLLEAPHFQGAHIQHSFANLIKQFPVNVLASMFMGGLSTIPFMTAITFVSPVLMSKGYFTHNELMICQTILSFISILAFIPAGLLADRFSPYKVMQTATCLLILLSWPLLWLIDQGNFLGIILALMLLMILNELFLGPCHAFLKNLFPMPYRYRGSSFGFGVGMSLFGGLTPLVENYLYQNTHSFSGIAYWLILISFGTLCTMQWVNKKTGSKQMAEEEIFPLPSSVG